ncbi:MAG: PQQ-binding-like beta-propeller repeat protein, partial [Thermoplasmata archaeon]|nr:PQQ-binding-like beta-propeller repeat protein [Thermoplasmata archaeon]
MENRIWLALVIAMGLAVVIFQTSPLTAAITQMSFTFDTDTDTPLFLFEENLFNDTATTQQYDYNQTGNVTYWINIPKTANITNATMNVTGRIIYIYNTQVIASGIQGISIGNISGNGDNEIMVGTQGNDGRARALYGVNGTEIWDSLIQANNEVYSTSIGEVNSSSTGNEILVGSEDTYVYLLNRDGTKLWSNMTGGEVKSVLIDDIHGIGVNKMIVGADDVYVYNDDLTYNWTASISQTINAIAVGNLTSDSGNETVVGCNSGYVYIINSSGNITSTFILGTSAINSVDIGNVTDSPENEIVVGSANNNISVINASGEYIWNYTTGGAINDVKIGNSTAEYAGNEVIAGSDDQRVYTLDKYGNLIWSFEAASYVNTIEIGNVTSDPGNEVLAGAGDGYLYVFNFDYFPTNVSMDVGTLDANYDWNLEGKLRNTTSADGFADEIQTFLDSCTADADGSCNVSF